MDPITAVGIASSTIQLGDFMFKLISGTRSIYKSASGTSRQNETIEVITLTLQALMLEVSNSAADAESRVDRGILESAKWCSKTAQELLDMLAELKRGEKTVWKSFRAALKSARHWDRVDVLFETIGRMQLTLMTQLQFVMSDKQSKMTETLRRIDASTENLGLENIGSLIQFRDSILETIKESEAGIKAALENFHITTQGNHLRTGFTEDVEYNIDQQARDRAPEIGSLVNKLLDQKAKYENDHAFLSSLLFDDMRLRQESVKATYSDTFQWIFLEDPDENPAIHYPTWLKEGKGVFWVSGKAGSGKSTLMKLLSQSPHTHDMLKTWAGDKGLAIARYYFWNAGSRLQKTREGLIQTLLFELLRACPDAIPFIRRSIPDLPTGPGNWAMSKLMAAVTNLVAYPLSKKFCFFIDGLDEFEGDMDDLIGLMDQLASSDKVKVCCSSRPWTSFEDAFGQNKDCKLRLEDLTQRDIRKFVTDNFQQHKRFHKHAQDARFLALVEEVVKRANGVFLWVVLVVKSLRDGLTHADRIVDLERRLKAMPTDLEQLYQRMIQSVSPFYRQQSSELLLLVNSFYTISNYRNFPAIYLNILDEFDDNPAVLTSGVKVDILGDVENWLDDMARRVDARTKGLIELINRDEKSNERATLERIGRFNLSVLHRSVLDFLKKPAVADDLKRHCRPDFNPPRRLLQAATTFLLSPTIPLIPNNDELPPYDLKLRYIFWLSRGIEIHEGKPPTDLLKIARKHYPTFHWEASRHDHERATTKMTTMTQGFLSVAIEKGLNLYIADVLRENPNAINDEDANGCFSALFMALLFWPSFQPHISLNTVRLILENGADVSKLEGDTGRTAWSILLEFMDSQENEVPRIEGVRGERPRFRDDAERREIFALLISHEAEMGDERAERVVRELFNHKDAEYLFGLSLYREKRTGEIEEGIAPD